jgi:hypothetical protein
MTKPRPELLAPQRQTDIGKVERWSVGSGLPTADRQELKVTAEFDDNERGRSTRLVAMTASRLDYENDIAEIIARCEECDIEQVDQVLSLLPLARVVAAQGLLARLDLANDTIGSIDSRRVGALVGMIGAEKAHPILFDLWARSLNTKGETGVYRTIRKHHPKLGHEIAKYRRTVKWHIDKAVRKRARLLSDERLEIGDTDTMRYGADLLLDIALSLMVIDQKTMEKLAEGQPQDSDEQPQLPEKHKSDNGLWDNYQLFPIDERSKHPSGSLGRSWTPSPRGSAVGQVSREITDPDSRIFRRRRRGRGGVVVIDCSGSMSLTERDIEAILTTAGGAVVLGYTERGGLGEIRYLADGTRRVREVPDSLRHGAGNGVDGEALRIGAKHHRKGEPFIWVTDGGVCTHTRASFTALRDDCRKTMSQERGLYAHDTADAVRLLKALGRGATPKTAEPIYFRGD